MTIDPFTSLNSLLLSPCSWLFEGARGFPNAMTKVPIRKKVKERCITQSRDINRAAREFLDHMRPDIDLFRVHVE